MNLSCLTSAMSRAQRRREFALIDRRAGSIAVLARSYEPTLPVAGASMPVSHRNDDDPRPLNLVNDAVRKSAE